MTRLTDLVTTPFRWAADIVIDFYATLWIHLDHSYFWFMYRGEQYIMTREFLDEALRISPSNVRMHELTHPGVEPPRRS